jgi:GNAT superfamily N-acetyltransferase
MAEVDARVDKSRLEDVGRIVEIVRGLPEWFTPNAAVEVGRATKSMPGFVVRIGRVVRGFILSNERECCVEIAWLAVERAFQDLCLGRLLLKAAEDCACSKGKPVLTVKTYERMDHEPYLQTLAFYEGKGFKLYEIVEVYKPFVSQPAAILIKSLRCNESLQEKNYFHKQVEAYF